MNVKELINKLQNTPDQVVFSEVIATIDSAYDYTPSRFSNGLGESKVVSEAGSNEGSCKILAFAKLNTLSPQETLHCFGDYYRKDVLQNPTGTDHANIRNFMQHGWDGIQFTSEALKLRD